jgi:hypothetical protein
MIKQQELIDEIKQLYLGNPLVSVALDAIGMAIKQHMQSVVGITEEIKSDNVTNVTVVSTPTTWNGLTTLNGIIGLLADLSNYLTEDYLKQEATKLHLTVENGSFKLNLLLAGN